MSYPRVEKRVSARPASYHRWTPWKETKKKSSRKCRLCKTMHEVIPAAGERGGDLTRYIVDGVVMSEGVANVKRPACATKRG